MARYQPISLGSQIAGYQVEREIGRGGTGVVYLATDLRLGRAVALKVLPPEQTHSDAVRRTFLHESRVAAAMDHPHIVPIFASGEFNGVLYIAMHYVSGPDLGTLLDRDGPLPLTDALLIAAQVASALDAAHEHHLVHGDVKPGNILVATGGVGDVPYAYLTDFGMAKSALAASPNPEVNIGIFEEVNIGTFEYVTPEKLEGHPVDGRGDLYSLACVVYEALVGEPAFHGGALELMHQHLSAPPPELSGKRPGLAPAVDRVMAKAMAKAPEDRYGSCRDFVADLGYAAGGRVR
ncbi:serine/threonine-protein kinase [Streptomyces sp. NPDC002888]|uniref:serine/threonine-protein kinase n=1 Tax=Streptomyces sp. NPDC002888 TaxID=3364668 RepID=UPI003684A6A3